MSEKSSPQDPGSFEVTELDDHDLDAVSGGVDSGDNNTNCGCGCNPFGGGSNNGNCGCCGGSEELA